MIQQDQTKWYTALSYELGRLIQSINVNVHCTDAMNFVHPSEIPINQKVTYASFMCDYRPLKPEKWRARLLVYGDILPYYNDTRSHVANFLGRKILFNSVISDAHQGACFMTLDIKDYFLASPTTTSE